MCNTKKHVLIVEDEAAIARLMEINLQQAGYHTSICGDGAKAMQLLADNEQQPSFDIVILDRMLPSKRGLDILRWMRVYTDPDTGQASHLNTMPVLMVTALSMMEERVRGLNEGADDYLAKPFEPEELTARIAALLRRTNSQSTASFNQAAIQLNEAQFQVQIEGKAVTLRLLEFKLLQTLMQKPGRIFAREQLLDLVWGMDSFVEERTVDATIKRLRKELTLYGQGKCIQTVRGMGYRFQGNP
ncbi:MAG: response regulator transcription factor [Mariprofundaceae bacterium]|nr:response regulator transcription factor [Mariprofundaceae bacterium]